MIKHWEILENKWTKGSAYILGIEGEDSDSAMLLKELDSFCSLIDVRVVPYTHMFELPNVADDDILNKIRTKIQSLISNSSGSDQGDAEQLKVSKDSLDFVKENNSIDNAFDKEKSALDDLLNPSSDGTEISLANAKASNLENTDTHEIKNQENKEDLLNIIDALDNKEKEEKDSKQENIENKVPENNSLENKEPQKEEPKKEEKVGFFKRLFSFGKKKAKKEEPKDIPLENNKSSEVIKEDVNKAEDTLPIENIEGQQEISLEEKADLNQDQSNIFKSKVQIDDIFSAETVCKFYDDSGDNSGEPKVEKIIEPTPMPTPQIITITQNKVLENQEEQKAVNIQPQEPEEEIKNIFGPTPLPEDSKAEVKTVDVSDITSQKEESADITIPSLQVDKEVKEEIKEEVKPQAQAEVKPMPKITISEEDKRAIEEVKEQEKEKEELVKEVKPKVETPKETLKQESAKVVGAATAAAVAKKIKETKQKEQVQTVKKSDSETVKKAIKEKPTEQVKETKKEVKELNKTVAKKVSKPEEKPLSKQAEKTTEKPVEKQTAEKAKAKVLKKAEYDHTIQTTSMQVYKKSNWPIEMPIVPSFTLESMDMSSNRFSHAAAMSMVENPGMTNNPFFLYGESGSGKTHFLNALGVEFSKKFPIDQIFITNGVRFSRGIQRAIENNSIDSVQKFLDNAQVLIIDDIHLTAVNEVNKDFISKALNDFVNQHKQLVIASKYPPQGLSRFEELINFKLSQGWVSELKPLRPNHFLKVYTKMAGEAHVELTEAQCRGFFGRENLSLGMIAKDIKRAKVLNRRIEGSGSSPVSYEEILNYITAISGEDTTSQLESLDLNSPLTIRRGENTNWGNFGFFFPKENADKFKWIVYATMQRAKELGIQGGFNFALKSAYSTEHIIASAFKIANVCDSKNLKAAIILGPDVQHIQPAIRENFFDILSHMLEVMMIRCAIIPYEDIKRPSTYVKVLGDVLK